MMMMMVMMMSMKVKQSAIVTILNKDVMTPEMFAKAREEYRAMSAVIAAVREQANEGAVHHALTLLSEARNLP